MGATRGKQALGGMAAAVVIGASAVIATAAPAQADAAQCVAYLDQYYDVGPRVQEACKVADTADNPTQCRTLLLRWGVSADHASVACALGVI